MNKKRSNILARLHQIQALDSNASSIYADMAGKVEDPELCSELKIMVEDEQRHVNMTRELISSLERNPSLRE